MLDADVIDDPGFGDGGNRMRDEFDIVPQQCRIEGAGQDRSLTRIGVLGRHHLQKIGPILEDGLHVEPALAFAQCIHLGAGTMDAPSDLPLFDLPEQAEALSAIRQWTRELRPFFVREVPVPLGNDPTGLALEERDLVCDGSDGGQYLRSRGSGSDKRDAFPFQVMVVLPTRSVELGAFEFLRDRASRGHAER